MSRGQCIRFSIEVDLTKPLLSKFRLNGRVWGIKYEGMRQICFKCGKLGHKEGGCDLFQGSVALTAECELQENAGDMVKKPTQAPISRPEEVDKYGAWMMVQRPIRRHPPQRQRGVSKSHDSTYYKSSRG